MNRKLLIQFFAGILFLVSGIVALIKGIIQPSDRSTLVGIGLIIAAALLLFTEDHNRRELKPVRVRARN